MQKSRRLLIIVYLLVTTDPLYGQVKDCGSKLGLIALGIPAYYERQLVDLVRLPVAAVAQTFGLKGPRLKQTDGVRNKRSFALTGRSPLEYFDQLALYTYDLRGKQILDVASGNGRFGQVVNWVYGSSGTHVKSLDLMQRAPFPSIGSDFQKGDAFEMPFADKTYDLTLNNFMAYYYAKTPQFEPLVSEHIRVTKDGGEVRINLAGLGNPQQEKAFYTHIAQKALRNPRVKRVEFSNAVPSMAASIVVMKIFLKESSESNVVHGEANEPHITWTRHFQFGENTALGAEFALIFGYRMGILNGILPW